MAIILPDNIENKETWLKIIDHLYEIQSNSNDMILFGSSVYETGGNDFDICIIINSFFNIQYLIQNIEYHKKHVEEDINKEVHVCYLYVGDIRQFVKNYLVYNILFKIGVSVKNIDYSKYYLLPGEKAYKESNEKLIDIKNMITEELTKDNPDQILINESKEPIIKELSVRMSLFDQNVTGHALYTSYKRIKFILEVTDTDNLLKILDKFLQLKAKKAVIPT